PARRVLLRLWPVRDFPGAALPGDAHGVAWRALLDVGLGLGLFVACLPVELVRAPDPRAGVAVARERAGAVQDAPPALRRLAGALCRHRLGPVQARVLALAAVCRFRGVFRRVRMGPAARETIGLGAPGFFDRGTVRLFGL